jgi:hypothetical protein
MIDPNALEAAARAVAEDGFGADWPHSMRTATAAITAYLQARSEAGFVEVPREPTGAMVTAGWPLLDDATPIEVYRAMISAHGGAE